MLQKLFTSKLLKSASIASLLLFPATGLQTAVAADRIYATYGAFESSVAIEDLAKFAKTGEIEGGLIDYARRLTPAQLERLRGILTTPVDLSPVAISQFLYSSIGETLLQRLGQLIRTEATLPGFYAIRSALILAAAENRQGFTLLDVLRQFPTNGIRVDLGQSLEIVEELQAVINRTNEAIALVQRQSAAAAIAQQPANFSQLPDLRQRGRFTWTKRTLELYDSSRDRAFIADLYLPNSYLSPPSLTPHSSLLTPVIVISHGLGSDRNSFGYLAQQLASYGFAVAVPEHPNSNAEQLRSLLNGRATAVTPPREFINRPLDVSYLLDVLAQLDRTDSSFALNLQQVGVVGHSYGGYTALALAGAKLNFNQLQQDCENLGETFNLSLLLQCRTLELPRTQYNLRDKRIKAAIAINPIASALFGKAGLSQIKIPVTIASSSDDKVAPALPEQILPFTWLTAQNKYLLLLAGGTHFSAADKSDPGSEPLPIPESVIGPDPSLARRYLGAWSVAFFETYVAGSQQYRPYLSADYARFISQMPLTLSLVQSLPLESLTQ
ncbi:alpha/beta hydrolase [Scytonema millei]|uniref:Alpha/beta fold hydrolase n=1 Tax=Scytonema millei VB511283 TaxID=1245923 RepID=A0A9X5EBH4_9CYAN|nr:alpha/beta hydrolase [Scytonema millei]NHC37354.1 alpha/beta fold hydrolase [Scytonema millei VB511283]